MNPIETLLHEMDHQRNIFTNVKAYFPTMGKKMVGQTQFSTAPYYRVRGFHVKFVLDQPITEDHLKQNNKITRWMNENYIVRLCALLESHGIFSKTVKIDQSVEGWEDIDILRRLRDVFAHTSGKYNPNDRNQRILVKKINAHYGLDATSHPNEIPLAIDTVIDPLFKRCKKYIQHKAKK
jgi:hypothetical protein